MGPGFPQHQSNAETQRGLLTPASRSRNNPLPDAGTGRPGNTGVENPGTSDIAKIIGMPLVVHCESIHEDMDFISVMGYSHVVNDVRNWSRDARAMGMSDLKVLCMVRATLDKVMCDTDVLKCAPEASDRLAHANAAVRAMVTPMQSMETLQHMVILTVTPCRDGTMISPRVAAERRRAENGA